jgi:hypothetical protein
MVPLACNGEEEHPQEPPQRIPFAGLTTALYPAPHPIPAMQLLHVDPPTIELHVPGAQNMQTLAPASPLYVPAVQFVQTFSEFAPTAVLYVPALHLVQTPALAALYVPAVHSVQTLDSGEL